MVARLLVGAYLYFHLRPHSDDLLSPGSVASRLVGLQDALGQVGYVSNWAAIESPPVQVQLVFRHRVPPPVIVVCYPHAHAVSACFLVFH
jgi:hypothetical protein